MIYFYICTGGSGNLSWQSSWYDRQEWVQANCKYKWLEKEKRKKSNRVSISWDISQTCNWRLAIWHWFQWVVWCLRSHLQSWTNLVPYSKNRKMAYLPSTRLHPSFEGNDVFTSPFYPVQDCNHGQNRWKNLDPSWLQSWKKGMEDLDLPTPKSTMEKWHILAFERLHPWFQGGGGGGGLGTDSFC